MNKNKEKSLCRSFITLCILSFIFSAIISGWLISNGLTTRISRLGLFFAFSTLFLSSSGYMFMSMELKKLQKIRL